MLSNRWVYSFFLFVLLLGASNAQANSISGSVVNSDSPGHLFVEIYDNNQFINPIEMQYLGQVASAPFQLGATTPLVDGTYYLRASVDTAFDGPIISPGEPFVESAPIVIAGGVPVTNISLIIGGTAGTISTIAGGGIGDPNTDGIAAWDARVNVLEMVSDSSGNLYFSDSSLGYHRIRKIDLNGIVTTIAGTPSSIPFDGDGGPAINASLLNPRGLAIDGAGNLYVSEMNNNAIRKIDTNGIITTVAGINGGGTPFQGDGGPALNASILGPLDIAFDGLGNLYIAEYGARAIRKINPNGLITTVAGDGSGAGSMIIDGSPASMPIVPFYLDTDSQGRIYFSFRYNQVLTIDGMKDYVVLAPGVTSGPAGQYRVIASTQPGTPYYYTDGYPAINTKFRNIAGVEVDGAGNIYVADRGDYRVRKIDAVSMIVSTVAGNGVRNTNPTTNGDGGPAITAELTSMVSIAIEASGGLLISDNAFYRIRRVTDAASPASSTGFSGIITYANGLPAVNAYVTAYDVNATWDPVTGQTTPAPVSVHADANGNYQFSGILPGTYYLDVMYMDPVTGVPNPVFPNGDQGGPFNAYGQVAYPPSVPAMFTVTQGQTLTNINAQLYNPMFGTSISGSITYASGLPALDAYVTALDVNATWDPFTGQLTPAPVSVMADANGNYIFPAMMPGTYNLDVQHFNTVTGFPEPVFPNGDQGGPIDAYGQVSFSNPPAQFTVSQGQALTGVNAQLYNPTFGTSISGSVTYASGLPALDAYVTALDVNATWDPITGQSMPAPVSVVADANGNYIFPAMMPGTYNLNVMYMDPVTGVPNPVFPNGDQGGPIDAYGQVSFSNPPAQFTVAQGQALTGVNAQLLAVDSDGDGVPDTSDAFPTDPAASVDTDADGHPDSWNVGKSAVDSTTGLMLDAFPTDPAASVDTDGDGHPDAWNTGKTAADSTTGLTLDAFPADPAEWADTDGDGIGDNGDAFPTDASASVDTDGDGHPDAWNTGKTAADSTTGLTLDAFPNDSAASVDSDGDGHPDAWNAGKAAADSTTGRTLDVFPADPTEWADTDGDGIGDNGDAFPIDVAASIDSDGDGFPDSWNVGMSQADSSTGLILDLWPNNSSGATDSDIDGIADEWERRCFGDLQTADASSDFNYDGKLDLTHFAEGSFPGAKAAISVGTYHALALKADGSVVAWGSNNYGQTQVPAGLSGVVAIAAGGTHSLAIKFDGSVVAWGSWGYGEGLVPAGLSSVTAISAGNWYSIALKSDGHVVAWGLNDLGQTQVPAGLSDVVAIAAGGFHGLALKTDGTVVGWGLNASGQTAIPPGLSAVTSVAAGRNHSLALLSNGTVVSWGDNTFGQGITPSGLSGVAAIEAGDARSLALKNDGTLVGWGDLSPGGVTAKIPVGISNVDAIAAGDWHSLALKSDGTVVGWGNDYTLQTSQPTGLVLYGDVDGDGVVDPLDAFATDPAASVDSDGDGHPDAWNAGKTAADSTTSLTLDVFPADPVEWVDTDGDGIGDNGDAFPTDPAASVDTDGDGYPDVWNAGKTVADSTMGLTLDLWPNNRSGATDSDMDGIGDEWERRCFGDLLTADATTDFNFDGKLDLTHFMDGTFPGTTASVTGGGYHSLALKSDGTVVGWGGAYSQAPAGLSDVVAIAAGRDFSLVLKSDGTVMGWGNNASGQTTVPAGLSSVVAIAANNSHSLALKSDGTVVGWGDNTQGQTTIPVGLSGVVAIAAGYKHSLALKSDGTVVAWGDNSVGRTTIPVGLSGVVSIVAGNAHSLALKSDGTVVGWGYNIYGQATMPTGHAGVVGIAAGGNHSLALKSDGTVIAWGSNFFGETTIPVEVSGVDSIGTGYDHSLALKSDGTVVGWGDNTQSQITIPTGLVLYGDADGDGVVDPLDIFPTDPLVSGVDSDADGIDDAWERFYFGDLVTADATTDANGNGVLDIQEYLNGTNPLQ